MLSKYSTLLFDIDDTLLDFHTAQKSAFKELLNHFNVPFTQESYERYNVLNKSLWHQYEKGQMKREYVLTERFVQFFKPLNITVDPIACDTLYRRFLAQGHQLFDGALDLIKQVSQTHELAIVTNGVYHTQMTRLENNQLLPFFKHIFISDQIGAQKPDSRFFDAVFAQMHITDPSSVLIIGDTLHADILGGQKVGIDTCWVNPKQLPNTLDTPPTIMIQHISELLH